MSRAYQDLAWSYDALTTDVDYPGELKYLQALFAAWDLWPHTILDLACGTGSMSLLLAQAGHSVTGVDLSEDMLMAAYNKALDLPADRRPQFVHQAMQALALPQPVDAAVCLLDSINYLTDPQAAAQTFRRVYRALKPGGLLIFDVNTLEKFRAMDGQVWLDEDDDTYCVWRTEFDEATSLCFYGVDLFRRRGQVWKRSAEEHREYAYTDAQLRDMLTQAGFAKIKQYGDRTLEPPQGGEQRVFYAAKKEETT